MELEEGVLERVRAYDTLSRWERSELGRDLRRLGLSYGEIMDLIPVKKSTLATWCRDVRLSEDQIAAIKERRAPEPGIPRNTQRKRHREIELIRAQARLEAEHLCLDPLWMAGVSMYLGGRKQSDASTRDGEFRPGGVAALHGVDPHLLAAEDRVESQAQCSRQQRRTTGASVVGERTGHRPCVLQQVFHQAGWDRSPEEPSSARGLHPDQEEKR